VNDIDLSQLGKSKKIQKFTANKPIKSKITLLLLNSITNQKHICTVLYTPQMNPRG